MNVSEWFYSEDPYDMLSRIDFSKRKLLLFGAAVIAPVQQFMLEERRKSVRRSVESYADGLITGEDLVRECGAYTDTLPGQRHTIPMLAERAAMYVLHAVAVERMRSQYNCMCEAMWYVEQVTVQAAGSPVRGSVVTTAVRSHHASLLREIWGNNPTAQPTDHLCQTPTVIALARHIYDEHRFEDLPILADALEETSYADAEILKHLRMPILHVRGCWALDLVLGKS